jgi:cytochrome c oxidase assembly protein subunit 15
MQPQTTQQELPSRWPHRVAVALAMVVFPLIWVGGLVTTYDAGMAVPDWPGTYGYNMFLYPIETWLFGPFDLLVEHGHRLLGSLAGLIAIVLVVVTFRKEQRRSVRWMSVGLLCLVIAQGLLGGMRVLMDARTLAKIHGCVGPAFFASVVGFCVLTSRWWWNNKSQNSEQRATSSLTTFAILMFSVSFAQLILGALLRHISVAALPTQYKSLVVFHICTAILLVGGTAFQWLRTRLPAYKSTGVRGSISVLLLLIGVQFSLGIGTWIVKFGWPVWFEDLPFAATFVVGEKTFLQMNLITAHVAVGSLILAFWVIHFLRCHRAIGASGLLGSKSNKNTTSNSIANSPEPLTTG